MGISQEGRLDDLLQIRDQYTILPTDFSQLQAIEQARQGGNLVIHGPPGTGKSQTIANLIATLLADRKRVLFVSEKTVALDVVKSRLEKCDLGVFCLDLHSDRGKKNEVYEQLRKSKQDSRERIGSPVSVDDLIKCRDRLNSVVRLLHHQHDTLGKSVYEVQGEFAQLRHLPRSEDFQVPHTTELTSQWIDDAASAADHIASRPEEFRNHHSSRWSLLRTPQLTLNFPDQIRKDMKDVREAVETLRERTDPHSRWLGLTEVESKEDIGTMTQLLQLLTQAPTSGIPGVWLDRNTAKRLIQVSEDRARQQQERRHLEKMLSSWFGNPLPLNLDYQAVKKAADLTSSEQEVIEDGIGIGWRTAIGPSPSALSDAATALSTALKTLSAEAKALAETLGGRECQDTGPN